jgi:hypothetical protein
MGTNRSAKVRTIVKSLTEADSNRFLNGRFRSGARGRNRTGMRKPSTDFRTQSTAFTATLSQGVWSLDYPFTMAITALGAARLVSTPSLSFLKAWLGIGTNTP